MGIVESASTIPAKDDDLLTLPSYFPSVTLTEGETRALLASALLVLLAALGRMLVSTPAARVEPVGLSAAAGLDSVLAVAESAYAESRRRRRPLAPGERIDPNTASEAELDRLPGIGPALARAIVLNRGREGPFGSLRDLERVPGLGSSILGRLARHTTLPARAAASEARGRASGRPGGIRRREARPEKPDLNRASMAELQALPGIGPVRAGDIVRYRKEHGAFRNFEDLLDVPGIGPATVERLRSLAVIGP